MTTIFQKNSLHVGKQLDLGHSDGIKIGGNDLLLFFSKPYYYFNFYSDGKDIDFPKSRFAGYDAYLELEKRENHISLLQAHFMSVRGASIK